MFYIYIRFLTFEKRPANMQIHNENWMTMNRQEKLLLKSAYKNDLAGVKSARDRYRSEFFPDCDGASLNTIDGDGNTAMHMAATRGHRLIVAYLLSQSAKHDVKNEKGETPFMMACIGGFRDVVQDLIGIRANILERDHKGQNTLMRTCEARQSHVVKYLLAQNRFDVNDICNEGKTALMRAAQVGDLISVEALIDAKADIDVRSNKNNTALMEAASHSHVNVVEYLLKHGADPTVRSNSGHVAADFTSNPDVRRMLSHAVKHYQPKSAIVPSVSVAAPVVVAAVAPTVKEVVVATPAANDTAKKYTKLQEKIRDAMENEGLDPDNSEHWMPIGDGAIEFVQAGTESPKMLGTIFNFVARQYSFTTKNMLNGDKDAPVIGGLDEYPNLDQVTLAHQKLKEMGKNPPEYVALRKAKPQIGQ